MTRPSLSAWFMSMAEVAAQRSTCLRAQVGCAIAVGNRLLAVGYNGAPAGMPHCLDVGCTIGSNGGCTAAHAEANALKWAHDLYIDVIGSTLYVTMQPCLDCARLIVRHDVAKVVYRDAYRKPDGADWLRERGVAVEQLSASDASGSP